MLAETNQLSLPGSAPQRRGSGSSRWCRGSTTFTSIALPFLLLLPRMLSGYIRPRPYSARSAESLAGAAWRPCPSDPARPRQTRPCFGGDNDSAVRGGSDRDVTPTIFGQNHAIATRLPM